MNTHYTPFSPIAIVHLVRRRWLVLAVTTAGFIALAVGYILFVPDTWLASQAITVRDEAALEGGAMDAFRQADERKNLQETILELGNDPRMLRTVLEKVGPSADHAVSAAWPTRQEIEDFAGQVEITPPKGAEFGSTDIFYIRVKSTDRNRAVALVDTIREQLQKRFQKMRKDRGTNLVAELEATVDTAKEGLVKSSRKVAKLEEEIGPDLGELRGLQNSLSADSSLRRAASEIETELRQARTVEHAGQELAEILRTAQKDPGHLVAAPNRLLESQPALRRLKDGLIDAQIATSELKGRMSEAHPIVQAAMEAEKNIGEDLHDEIAIALRGVELDMKLSKARCDMLESRLAETTQRLNRLAKLRTPYSNAVKENESRIALLRRAEDALVSAKAKLAGTNASTLLATVGEADTGARPLGPGKSVVLAGAAVGGFALGLGLIFLIGPVPPSVGADQDTDRLLEEWRSPAPVTYAAKRNGSKKVAREWRTRETAIKDAFRRG